MTDGRKAAAVAVGTIIGLIALVGAMTARDGATPTPGPDDAVAVVSGAAPASPRRNDIVETNAPANWSSAFAIPNISNPAVDDDQEKPEVEGFADRTGPPTIPGGGFNGAPDTQPYVGNVLDMP